jgi:hypothetical protein
MLQIDGKPLDLTNPSSWGDAVQIKQGGYISETKDGVKTTVKSDGNVTTEKAQ